MGDPKKILDSRDIAAAALYAKQVSSDAADLYPVLVDAAGNLRVNMTVGTVTLDSTASTITNAVGNPVNVSLTNTLVTAALSPTTVTVAGTVSLSSTLVTASLNTTKVTIDNTPSVSLSSTIVTVAPQAGTSLATTKVTVDNTVTTSLSSTIVTVAPQAGATFTTSPNTTAVTITNAAGNGANVTLTSTKVTVDNTVTVSLSSTKVTIDNNVTLASTAVTVSIVSGQANLAGGVGATGASVLRTVLANDMGRTLTTASGTLSATQGTITVTPTNRAKVYAISLTTTAATEVIAIFYTLGAAAATIELWRATLMAPAGANAGLNLAVTPPAYLFASRSATAISLSLNTATLVHYSVSYFDEA